MLTTLQWTPAKYESGMVDTAMLADGLLTRPHITKLVYNAFKESNYTRYLLSNISPASKQYEYVGNQEYKWFVQTDLTRPVNISSAVKPATNIGVNFSSFTVPFPERYFNKGDVVRFPSGIQAIILADPTQVGTEWIYTMKIVGSNPLATLSASDVAIGTPIACIYNAWGEGSKGASTKRAFPLGFANQTTITRFRDTITGSAATDLMFLDINTSGIDGKSFGSSRFCTTWTDYVTFALFNKSVETRDWYGEYNRLSDGTVALKDSDGHPILVGAGIIPQIAKSHTRVYDPTTFTERKLKDFLLDLQLASPKSTNGHWLCFAGAGFIDTFNTVLQNVLSGRLTDSKFYIRNDNSGKTNIEDTLEFGQEFTTYRGILGSKLTIIHLPLFDDRENFPALHPVTGLPKESYRAVFVPMETDEGRPNIQMIAKEGREMLMWYEAGSMIPEVFGRMIKDKERALRSSDVDGFSTNMLTESSVRIWNPMSCGMLYTV